MKKLEINTVLTVFESIDELPEQVKELMKKAVTARNNAYAPYSKFRVGAVLQLENGEIIIGSNQENAVYPSGLCAERVAIFQAGTQFPGEPIKIMAVSAASDSFNVLTPTPPCGACRQSIYEYEENQKTPIALYFMGETGKVVKADSIKDLLPLTFGKATLNNI
ncbi:MULTISPECIES: cytidine deaminase [Galbibacter]|uniref:Cytidine deaminase n=1 Tax=Galbibacter pacificus TaxID=2996052 RepID=A0ABT6FVU3_9FLAO|nr:cytidine deaminase [Galbibacter pacificus]MDG3583701.1 cytidine deaminase [Galbibacter pacificus]MDG3587381.1 cytidine deaminase [Galbibacter pacificus]